MRATAGKSGRHGSRRPLDRRLRQLDRRHLAIAADKAAPWGQVVKVMDIAKEAKLKPGTVNAFMKEAKGP